jgi:hypothetical protein
MDGRSDTSSMNIDERNIGQTEDDIIKLINAVPNVSVCSQLVVPLLTGKVEREVDGSEGFPDLVPVIAPVVIVVWLRNPLFE